jgi:hypothetical protein
MKYLKMFRLIKICKPMTDVSNRVNPCKMHSGLKQGDVLVSPFLNFVA